MTRKELLEYSRLSTELETLEVNGAAPDIIEGKRLQCLRERIRLECYISGIPDSCARLIFMFRFIYGLPWAQVAQLMGRGFNAGSIRQHAYRSIKKTDTQ